MRCRLLARLPFLGRAEISSLLKSWQWGKADNVKMSLNDEPQATFRKEKRVKLTMQDAEAIAELVAKSHLNETEACLNLDIKPLTWFRFKERAKVKADFVTMLSRLKGSHIRNCIERINKSGDGIGVKQADWRAKAWILERVAPERFALNTQNGATTVNLQVIDISSMRRAFDTPPRALNAVNSHPDSILVSERQNSERMQINGIPERSSHILKSKIPAKKA